jgi:hypothetical protein
MRKSSLFLFFFFLVNLLSASTCFAAEPLRIAILPVINQTHTRDESVEKIVSGALHAKFHRPLSNIVTVYQMIPDDEVNAALLSDIGKLPASLKFKPEILPGIAEKLQADIVIGAVITDLRERTFGSWVGDYLQETHLAIRLVVYTANTQKHLDKRDSENYFGEQMLHSEAAYFAQVIMDRLLSEVVFNPE